MPKLQILIYPWTQLFNYKIPSHIEYSTSSLFGVAIPTEKAVGWYLGIENPSVEFLNFLKSNNHTALINDKALKDRLKSYMDINKIPEKYKTGRRYYKNSKQDSIYPDVLNDNNNVLTQDTNIVNLISKLHHPSMSPLFAEDSKLVGLPKTLMAIFEWDSLKVIYSTVY